MADPMAGGEIFYVSGESPVSVLAVVKMIVQLMGRQDLSPQLPHQPTATAPIQRPAARKIKLLGWQPRISLETGLQKTIAWYRLHSQQSA
ncbi:MAG TPA: hypothetical protein VNN62_03470 [Methylomirabilota bacterium]|jgi:nucleoside-diphosphate-sugar epimerase|nr:hypothetical protein [Methylomirabilota bacterium]